MKSLIIAYCTCYIVLIYTLNLQGQNINVQYRSCTGCTSNQENDEENDDYTYGPIVNFATHDVSSDYGPRSVYDWHGGVDYTAAGGDEDRGDLIIALDGGTVRLHVTGQYKWIGIVGENRNFGYGHIFRRHDDDDPYYNFTSGECALRFMMGENCSRVAIIVPVFNADNQVVGHSAYGEPIEGCIAQVEFEGQILPVNTNINAGDVVGPIGDSYNSLTPLAAHLHLYSFPDVATGNITDGHTKNPLEFVDHAIPDYQVQILRHNNQTIASPDELEGIDLVYPGNLPSKLKIRALLSGEGNGERYQNSVMNVNSIHYWTL